MTPEVEIELPGPDATLRLGEELGCRLQAGDVLALIGELGAGKTCLARGVARGLRVEDPGAVASPTYLLVVEHEGVIPMIHVDAYLAPKTRAFLADGGADWLAERAGVVVVEWADRIANLLPEETLTVRLEPRPDGLPGRRAQLRGPDRFAWIRELPGAARSG
ncbi:MAG: tRNA (adenosine(37)-N6)-threonylcarbamoyltransferase complex ATPase subunit type 1 TsaE [Planctomycetota bacterium]